MNCTPQINYANVCRTCLSKSEVMISIYDIQHVTPEEEVYLYEMLISCATVQVVRGDGLPEGICLACSEQMSSAFLFRKLCEKSDLTLREHFNKSEYNAVKEGEIGNIVESKEIDLGMKNSEENVLDLDSNKSLISNKDRFEEFTDLNDTRKNLANFNSLSKNESSIWDQEDEQKSKVNGGVNENVNLFKCEICNKTFKYKHFLIRHIRTHTNPTDDELNTVKTKGRRKKTDIVKKRNQPRTCNICNKTFRFHSNLVRHKLIHTGEKPCLCNVCGKGFAQMAYLKIHSFIHTGEKPYKCELCHKSFAAPGTLMTHVRTHTGERPHSCNICGKEFSQSGYLAAHIRTHTGEKPAECKVCKRRFNQTNRLKVHMRIHSGEKPYQCKDCGRCFAVKGTLQKHIRTHTGERPYVCSVCGHAFGQSGTLATHMKVHKNAE